MATERTLPGAVSATWIACFVSVAGWLWLATPAASSAVASVPARKMLKPFALALSALTFHLGSVVLAVAGVLPVHRASAAVLVTTSFLALGVASYRVLVTLGVVSEQGDDGRRLFARHGFWLIAIIAVMYLPMLGNFALLDPWETHYGEVAREMLARSDWISLWWAQDGWFFTKPILNFWLQGLSFQFFGVEVMPDKMLSGVVLGRVPQPEWACRLPIFWFTLAATYALYKASAHLVGRRAAFLGGVVLATCPYWLLLARQTMADMPYVAPLCVALALLLIGFHTDPEARVREFAVSFGARTLRFDAYHVVFGGVLLCVVPQVAYLMSRNVTFHLGDPFGFRAHLDEFSQGSGGGNCGLPGNMACDPVEPIYSFGQPAFAGLYWLGLALGLLLWNRRERRAQRLLFLAAWLATALSVMAKGAPGLVLPLVTAIGYPVVLGRFRDLLRLKLPSLLVLTACVSLPWYFQMYMRHGWPFFDRLVMHDMVNRAFAHVHDTNKGDDTSFRYYVWQLGYGLFPWTGAAAAGLAWWARSARYGDSKRQLFAVFLLLWFLAGFGMFSLTLTKFHHYVLPLVPPAALLTGVMLSDYVPKRLLESPRRILIYAALMLLAVQLLVLGVACFFPAWHTLLFAKNAANPSSPWLGAGLLVFGLAVIALAARLWPKAELEPPRARNWALSIFAVASCTGLVLAARDLITSPPGALRGEIRILHLITYNYDRPWPEELNLAGPIAGFAAVFVLGSLGLAVRRMRPHALALLVVAGVAWGVWCCDEYLPRIAPHWAQRDNMVAYYKHRDKPEHILVAYQMNWKGENFYTGNRMATFVSSGTKFKRWLKKQRSRGVDTMFFTTEHSRMKTLKKELGPVSEFEQLTEESDNNKFFVAKVKFPPYEADKADEKEEKDEESDEAE
jgi:4-amino-4-deoxy-L-arabinose transferase-like glycosyltransferase